MNVNSASIILAQSNEVGINCWGVLSLFLTPSGRGRKWTISKHFRTHLRLYLMSSTIDQIDENQS